MMPDFVAPAPGEYSSPDDPQEAITELLAQVDWAIARLTTEVTSLHGLEAVDVQREVTLRIRALNELQGSLRMAAAS